nr:chromosome partitioning protein [Cryobacterium frigoriphilum]
MSRRAAREAAAAASAAAVAAPPEPSAAFAPSLSPEPEAVASPAKDAEPAAPLTAPTPPPAPPTASSGRVSAPPFLSFPAASTATPADTPPDTPPAISATTTPASPISSFTAVITAPPTASTAPPAAASAARAIAPAIPAPLAVIDDPDSARDAGIAPNLADFLGSRPAAPTGPAQQGWQGAVGRLTGGLITFAPGGAELAQRDAISSVQRTLNGPRTIVVLNPKGGAHKTTATLLIAATFGTYRGGFTLAWDNNETMGTLGVRAQAAAHTNTAVDLLRDLERFGDGEARVGDLDGYVRAQGDAQFDALASDLDPAGAASIDAAAFGRLHSTLSRFYRVLVIDTGNNMRASNWEAAVDTADQLVIVSTIREDTGFGAAALIDGLRAKGHADKVAQAVTILASPSKTADPQLSRRLHEHFAQLTRTVLDVPFDASLVSGGPLNVDALAPRTRAAWLLATAAIADGL